MNWVLWQKASDNSRALARNGQEVPPPVRGPIDPAPRQPIALVGPRIDVPAPGARGFHVSNNGSLTVAGTGDNQGDGTKPYTFFDASGANTIDLAFIHPLVAGNNSTLAFASDSSGTLDTTRITAGYGSGGSWVTSPPYVEVGTDNTGAATMNVSAKSIDLEAGTFTLDSIDASGSFIQLTERTAPAAPAANKVRIYAVDNGAGKTQLMAIFGSGAAQQLAIEP